MPFITPERREAIDLHGVGGLSEIQPGDRCYVFYKAMVDKWKEKPSWTTAHEIYKDVMTTAYGITLHSIDNVAAKHLAWQVFFQLHVMPYELKKRDENGDI